MTPLDSARGKALRLLLAWRCPLSTLECTLGRSRSCACLDGEYRGGRKRRELRGHTATTSFRSRTARRNQSGLSLPLSVNLETLTCGIHTMGRTTWKGRLTGPKHKQTKAIFTYTTNQPDIAADNAKVCPGEGLFPSIYSNKIGPQAEVLLAI